MSLQSEILDGLALPDWNSSISQVKNTIRNAIRAIDQRVVIEDTEYFNHTFAPDFVLSWPGSPTNEARPVFLRLKDEVWSLLDDLSYVGGDDPLLLGLTSFAAEQDDSVDARRVVDQGIRNEMPRGAMVTEPDAFEQLAPRPNVEFGNYVSSALLRSGRGIVTEETSAELGDASASFFAAARVHDGPDLERSAESLREHLAVPEAERLVSFGRVVWEATGGSPVEFPVSAELSGRTDDLSLQFLLTEQIDADVEFWRAIGRGLRLEDLFSLGAGDWPNLRRFVEANADRLRARAFKLEGAQGALSFQEDDIDWSIGPQQLTAVFGPAIAYFALRKGDLPQTKGEPRTGLTLRDLTARTSGRTVGSIEVSVGDERVTISGYEIDTSSSPSVSAMLSSPQSRATEVTVDVEEKALECDLRERTAAAPTAGLFSIQALLAEAVPILVGDLGAEIASYAERIGNPTAPQAPLGAPEELPELNTGSSGDDE